MVLPVVPMMGAFMWNAWNMSNVLSLEAREAESSLHYDLGPTIHPIAALVAVCWAGWHYLGRQVDTQLQLQGDEPPITLHDDLRLNELIRLLNEDKSIGTFDASMSVDGETIFRIQAQPDTQNVSLQVVSSTPMISEEMMTAMRADIDYVVKTALNGYQGCLSDLEFLCSNNRKIIETVNSPPLKTVWRSPLDQILYHAMERPFDVAVDQGTMEWTYSELAYEIGKAVHLMTANGVGARDTVLIHGHNGIEYISCVLALQAIGAVFVPLDSSTPLERVHQIVGMLDGLRLVIFSDKDAIPLFRETCNPDKEIPAIAFSELYKISTNEGVDSRPTQAFNSRPEDTAYIIFTSGSTGKPKGVPIPQIGMCSLLECVIERWNLTRDTRFLQFARISFDAHIPEWAATLMAGGTAVFVGRRPVLPDLLLQEDLRRFNINTIKMPASALGMLDPTQLTHLETVITAGEACTTTLAKSWCKQSNFFNCYGPTEVAIGSTMERFCEDDDGISLGYANNNTRIEVLGRDNIRCTPLTVGEIAIAGIGVTTGYVDGPTEDLQRVEHGDFGGYPRRFLSGDYGYIDAKGRLQFVGRQDQQVKIRGNRVELSEVESVMMAACEMREVCALEVGGALFVAFVPIDKGIESSQIKEALASQLPDYMIPTVFREYDILPRTGHNKIDRNAIKASLAEPQTENQEPCTDILGKLEEIWLRPLTDKKIVLHKSFLDHGGDSLSAIGVTLDILEEVGISLDVRKLLDNTSFESFIKYAMAEQAAPGETTDPAEGPQIQLDGSQRILIINGSDRSKGLNGNLCQHVAGHLTSKYDDVDLVHLEDIPMPLYSQAIEATGIPKEAYVLAEQIDRADWIVLCSPEHNASIPACLKNMLDWVSRATEDWSILFRDCHVICLSANGGMSTSSSGLDHLKEIAIRLGANLDSPKILFAPYEMGEDSMSRHSHEGFRQLYRLLGIEQTGAEGEGS